jgi:Transcriptional regulators
MAGINKEKYSEQIYEDIKQDILNNRIGFNQKLTNRDLQQKYGVSSTPVRDAINKLYLDGFVSEINNTGAKTTAFDRSYALEINEIISMLADDAVSLSSSRSDIKEVAAVLNEKIALQEANLETDDFYKYDDEFHFVFFQFSGNDSFIKLYERYNILRQILVRFTDGKNRADRVNALNQHKLIAKAYGKGDIILTRERMHDHYRLAMVKIEKGFTE